MKEISEISDNELLYMLRQKSDIALSILIRKYHDDAQRSISRNVVGHFLLVNRSDFYQLTLIKLIEAIESFREDKEASFRTYYHKVLRYCFVDQIRRNNSNQALYDKEFKEYNTCIGEYHQQYALSDKQEKQKNSLYEAIGKDNTLFSELEKKIIVLRGYGYSYKEIAEYYGIHTKKVDNTLRKIRKYDERKAKDKIH